MGIFYFNSHHDFIEPYRHKSHCSSKILYWAVIIFMEEQRKQQNNMERQEQRCRQSTVMNEVVRIN